MIPEIVDKGYEQLKAFAAGREVPARDWHDRLLQVLQLGYFEIIYNKNNYLKVTPAGSDVLFGRATARLVVICRRETNGTEWDGKHKLPVLSKELSLGLSNAENEDLFETLRELRERLVDEEVLPAYITLSDRVLYLPNTLRPTTIEEFENINGIGECKKKKCGKEFVSPIHRFSD